VLRIKAWHQAQAYFKRMSKIEKKFVIPVSLSVRPTTGLSVAAFSCNFIFEHFMKNLSRKFNLH